MKNKFVVYRSPKSGSVLRYENELLIDDQGNQFPVINSIPRFVPSENYSSSFGFQWNNFKNTQFDNSKILISKERFFKNTRWNENELNGKLILEVGSGAGRFTDVILNTEAILCTVDFSNSVEANYESNKHKRQFNIAQASIYELPFERNSFDFVFCFGVLQHTPNVKESFMNLTSFLKSGGKLSVDIYKKNWKTIFWSKYWFRPITKKMNHEKLLSFIKLYVPLWFPISSLLIKLPFVGKFLSQIIPICNYTLQFPQLTKNQLVEWAILDTFDMLSPAYDQPQSLKTLRNWADEAGLEVTFCGEGDNGYVLNAKKR